MQFSNPSILWFLLAIAIPIVIHLFHFRKYKRIFFSNVALLQNIQNKQQKQSKLKHFLVLCCRILTIAMLVFAFAQPVSKKALKPLVQEGTNYVSVGIDNSFSMSLYTDRGTLLEQAKQKAKEVVMKFKASDRFNLVTQDFWENNQRFVSQEEIIDAIEQLEIVPFSHTLNEILDNQKKVFSSVSGENKSLFLISDFQKTMMDVENWVADTLLHCWLLPVQSHTQNNISIDSIALETPVFQVGNEVEFQIWLSNHGNQALQEIPVRMWLENKVVSVGNIDLEPFQTKTIQRKLTLEQAGYLQGYFEISDHPITFDDRLYFTLNVLEKIPVLLVTESQPNSFLMKLLGENSSFDVQVANLQSLDYSLLSKVNFVILDELKVLSSGLQTELQTAVEGGATVLILPNEQSDLTSINTLTKIILNTEYDSIENSKSGVDAILSEHPIFRSAFVKQPERMLFPEVQKYFRIHTSARSTTHDLMRLNTNLPFLTYGDFGKGRMYLSAVPFDNAFSDFQNQPIFVVAILNMVLQSANNEVIYNSLNEQEAIIPNVTNVPISEVLRLKLENSDFEVVPRIVFRGREAVCDMPEMSLKYAGNYVLESQNQIVAELSYNFDRRESNLQSYSQSELEDLLQEQNLEGFLILKETSISQDSNLLAVDTGMSLWKWCLLLALIFLLTEAIILRFVGR